MRVPNDFEGDLTEAPRSPLQPRTAPLIPFPMSYRHTVRSVAQEACRTLWATLPDKADKWRRVGNMDHMLGVGRPIHTISKEVFAAAIHEMQGIGMPGPAIEQHLEDFGALMTWAVARGFAEWG
jgi:hypothetical protein